MRTRTKLDEIIVRDPEIQSGEPVFRGTRVTVATVFEHLEAGLSLEEILESFPTLDRADVVAVCARRTATFRQRQDMGERAI